MNLMFHVCSPILFSPFLFVVSIVLSRGVTNTHTGYPVWVFVIIEIIRYELRCGIYAINYGNLCYKFCAVAICIYPEMESARYCEGDYAKISLHVFSLWCSLLTLSIRCFDKNWWQFLEIVWIRQTSVCRIFCITHLWFLTLYSLF